MTPTPPPTLRLALDQNFPLALLRPLVRFLPADVELASLHQIDPRMSDLSDRQLVIALRQGGWDGLVTNNYKMLEVPAEIAAIVSTKLIVIAIEGLGHDPLRATGALLLELPGLAHRIRSGKGRIVRIKPHRTTEAWDYFRTAATKQNQDPATLWQTLKVTPEELTEPVLPPQTP